MIRRISNKRLQKEFGGVMPSSTVKPKADSKREKNRRLTGMGVSRRDEDEVQAQALAEVEAFLQLVRESPDIITGKRTGEWIGGATWGRRAHVDPAHIKGRGPWGCDIGNTVPLERRLHDELHQLGPADFQKKYKVSLRAAANAMQATWERENGKAL